MAEMTGRKGRVVADHKGRGVYTLRANPDSHEMDSLNVLETGMGQFFLMQKISASAGCQFVLASSRPSRILPLAVHAGIGVEYGNRHSSTFGFLH